MKEAPQLTFNTNVFKAGVKLDMNADELKKEEENVESLAEFINDFVIPELIRELKQLEVVPICSESLTDFFHKRGLNMRYLGKVIERLPEVQENLDKYKVTVPNLKMNGTFTHIKMILEREILLRSAKHVFNRVLKEESGEGELHFNQIISHLLNCLLAPSFFRDHLNSGKIKVVDESIQNAF